MSGYKDAVVFVLDKIKENIQNFIPYYWIQSACRLIQQKAAQPHATEKLLWDSFIFTAWE